MLVLEFTVDGSAAVLTDRNTGENVATVNIASIIQRHNHTAVRLGFEAPQHIAINRTNKGNNGFESRNGNRKPS